MKLGVLVSGGLGYITLMDLIEQWEVVFVMTDRKSDKIVSLCEKKGLTVYIGNPRGGRAEDFISDKEIDVLISVNYLFLIEQDLIRLPRQFALNIHGSLLPKYRGRTPHVWAIINNEKQTGATLHLIDEGCDTGDVVLQKTINIGDRDTGQTILDEFESLYPKMVNEVLVTLAKGEQLAIQPQDHNLATYFGKRTPEDGNIDWEWHKERISNWVRAQAAPYPGAFTFYKGEKVIIDQVAADDFGFHQNDQNGLILSSSPLRIKTPNGVLRVTKHRSSLDFESGGLLKMTK